MIAEAVLPQIKSGAKVRVFEKAGGRFEGLVIGRKHGAEDGASFTVRSVVAGVSVEKVYPIHSPIINKIEIISSPKNVHRSKLYFVRELSGRNIRKKLKVSL
jgi:large subunit ribosomal protein L19